MNDRKKNFIGFSTLTFTLLSVTLTVVLYGSINSATASDRNVLWDIISYCLDPSRPHYCEDCKWPIAESACSCLKTTEVWEKSLDYVAIRDQKMCGCPSDFVHGLALPLKKVTGVEDKDRPAGIWRFAWDVARKRIKESEIALVVNPLTCRSQDQLHVHIVKLNDEGRKFLESDRAAGIENLGQVWNKADDLARNAHLKNYGVLVKLNEKGFVVVVDDNCPEDTYTKYICDR
ncbi:MAG TPA: CDP-diacylglycerol diphosphatase [Thermodesulfovibrionales bacterium]|jgi:CDP-diacylglycerol pyrophosphatase|nr:CDP-diacylglycerol diphosphatase [Thermodesulfovibrionales bacterium]